MVTATHKRIFISVDMDLKNHTMLGLNKINLKRDIDNFDKKYVRPVNGIVIESEKIPKGAEVLMHHNATHETYMLFDYKELGGEYIKNSIRYFSIPESECYAWRLFDKWNPCEGFEFGLRIFKPYEGFLFEMLPKQIKNMLFITTGEYKDKAVITKAASDYEMTYQESNGKEAKLIRLRHFDEPENIREEIIAIDNDTTKKIKEGKLLIGYSPTNCKKYASKLSFSS